LNIILSGPTGTGKTTLARVLALMIPEGERTCVLETETELWLHELRRGFISLEERDANVEGAGRITLQDLFQRGALRQRPRRIIVGEVRGKEAMDMLHAMTSGHDGSLTTLHASGPRMALSRLEVLAMSADANLAPHVVRQMVGSGVDLVVHLSTFHRGEDEVRRLASLAFVAENPEDPLGSPIVSEAAVYNIADDGWEWRRDALMHMPEKIWRKLLVAGIDPEGLVRQVLSDGRG
jgi:pilus assembly protein CpaF